jgi:Uma2 family endonuclease
MITTESPETRSANNSVAVGEWQELLGEILPSQGLWTEEQYLILTDHRNRLIEFTDGFLEVLPMPTDKHQSILKFMFLAFFRFIELRGGTVQFSPLRLQIRRGKYREPDLLVFRSSTDPRRNDRFWLGADLTLEVVSEDKPERDLVDKVMDYAEARVPEYWIVNPQTETITVFQLSGDAYQKVGDYGRGENAPSVLFGGFTVSVSEALDTR